jgi:hypothetical protein
MVASQEMTRHIDDFRFHPLLPSTTQRQRAATNHSQIPATEPIREERRR